MGGIALGAEDVGWEDGTAISCCKLHQLMYFCFQFRLLVSKPTARPVSTILCRLREGTCRGYLLGRW